MCDAAAQAAGGGPAIRQALGALELDWDETYHLGYDDERGYWAERRDEAGDVLTAGEPDELRRKIREDYTSLPVARDKRACREQDGDQEAELRRGAPGSGCTAGLR